MIHESRIRRLNDRPVGARGRVVYWMQQAQRTRYNHALEFAVEEANRIGAPLAVYFFLTPRYPLASARHYAFMLRGLCDVRDALAARGVPFYLQEDDPAEGAIRVSRNSALTVADGGYIPLPRRWREVAAERCGAAFVEVESDVVAPARSVSPKKEYSAATFRRKIAPVLTAFLHPVAERALRVPSVSDDRTLDPGNAASIIDASGIAPRPAPVEGITGGQEAGAETLRRFIGEKLDRFDELRNDPGLGWTSGLSPYLHFGQVSPLEAALAALDTDSPGRDRFIEELVVRRELAVNYALYEPDCESYAGVPRWARESLAKHAKDPRPYRYGEEELESAATHDPCWNAAQRELVRHGRMHGYMRMYWAKKILEWRDSPEDAFRTALRLNDTYALDGRDPNSLAGVGWCFGLHDRPWTERPVFGMIRYMNEAGLRRKFDMDSYIARHGA